jgi:hypothetical protein
MVPGLERGAYPEDDLPTKISPQGLTVSKWTDKVIA